MIFITNYRGWDIHFDVSSENFVCFFEGANQQTKRSFSACKAFIDEFIKNNGKFEPFWIENNPNRFSNKEKLKIIGTTKDGRFMYEDSYGGKGIISPHFLDYYIVQYEENKEAWEELANLYKKEDEIRAQISHHKLTAFKIKTLRQVHEELNG